MYRARDSILHRDVALMIFPASFTLDADRLARFKREAQLLASLNHTNISAIHGFKEGPTQAIVLELVEGATLADCIALRPIPPEEAIPIALQIADALDAAHEKASSTTVLEARRHQDPERRSTSSSTGSRSYDASRR